MSPFAENICPLSFVDVCEVDASPGVEPLHWRLLTSHEVAGAEDAWRIVDWYKRRWIIEQFFRVLKTQGFKFEDSQIGIADRLLKLVAIAAKAAVITIQLLQARAAASSPSALPSTTVRSTHWPPSTANRSPDQAAKNPHSPDKLAWASWIIGRLGGWDGYPSSRPPAQSPSKPASNTSKPSQQDGASEICACPSAKAGTT